MQLRSGHSAMKMSRVVLKQLSIGAVVALCVSCGGGSVGQGSSSSVSSPMSSAISVTPISSAKSSVVSASSKPNSSLAISSTMSSLVVVSSQSSQSPMSRSSQTSLLSSVSSAMMSSKSSSMPTTGNLPPIAQADLLLVEQNKALQFDYLTANDTDPDKDTLNVSIATQPANGQVIQGSGNQLTYTPKTGFVGDDSFNYTVSDGRGGSATAAVTLSVNATVDHNALRNRLMSGVTSLSNAETRGYMAAFGPTSVQLGNFTNTNTPMAVASTLGSGRVVALAGLHWLNIDKTADGNMPQFYRNVLSWLANSTNKNIKIVVANVFAANWLKTEGYTNVVVTDNYGPEVSNAAVLIAWLGPDATDAQVSAVNNFLKNGGGAFLVEFGDGYQGYTNWWKRALPNVGTNRLLRKTGIVYGPGWNSAGVSASTPKDVSEDDLVSLLNFPERFTEADKSRLGEQLNSVFAALPSSDTLLARLNQGFNQRIATITPTPQSPIKSAFEKTLLNREADLLAALPPEKITAHRAAEALYGKIPASAARVKNQSVTINGNWSGWASTGLYVPPGELVTVRVPASLVGKGYNIRINGHTSNLSMDNDDWQKMPRGVHGVFPINSATVNVANPYGGALYIDLLEEANGKKHTLGKITISVDGALMAPYFVLGETTDAEWNSTIRNYPAPYAELVSDHLVLSVPSSMIRSLSNPTALTTYWKDFVAFQDWVGATEDHRTGPDRINYDVQICCGYLHAGYPIQGPAGVESSVNLLNFNTLMATGEWGYFHEMGHEKQDEANIWGGSWGGNSFTFDGDVEVTVNIFASAALEKMVPMTTASDWGYSAHHDETLKKSKATINDATKPKFEQKDPYPFYFSLADGFGWETYRKVLGSYVTDHLTNTAAIPKNNQEKKDQWLARWSQLSGYNMIEYFVNRWGLEVSQSAKDKVTAMNLPNWLPATTNIKHFSVAAGTEKRLDFSTTGLTLDGKATFVRVIDGENHTLTSAGNGIYNYKAIPGFTGIDTIKVVYKSEVGNEVTTVIYVQVK